MIYDAIINGARNLNFYGGNNPNCWNATDSAYGWSWTFWSTVLKGLIQEINATSPLGPALINPSSNQVLSTSDSTTQAISRSGSSSDDLWVIAARSGPGTSQVTIGGLPSSVTSGTVYTEGRSVSVTNGSFTDTFDQWGAHVYHFGAPTAVTLTEFAATRRGRAVVVSWGTAQEARVLGFNLYRIGGGRTAKVNPTVIAARGAASSARYRVVYRGARVASGFRLEISNRTTLFWTSSPTATKDAWTVVRYASSAATLS